MNEENYHDFLLDDAHYKTQLTGKYKQRKKYETPDPKMIYATLPGTTREIYVKEGDQVKKGEILLTFDAMKMHNKVFAQRPGIIKKINVEVNKTFAKGQLLITME